MSVTGALGLASKALQTQWETAMPELTLQKVPTTEDRSLPIFAEFDRLAERIRLEAYNLFAHRGSSEGHALDDWLAAERNLCWPAAKLIDRDGAFVLEVALAGFEANEISLTATPREIMIKANHEHSRKSDEKELRWSEFRSDEVYRRVEVPSPVDVGKTTATLKNGLLVIVAPQVQSAPSATAKVPITQGS
jgi:HSP20 family molecular chaperone IbpA